MLNRFIHLLWRTGELVLITLEMLSDEHKDSPFSKWAFFSPCKPCRCDVMTKHCFMDDTSRLSKWPTYCFVGIYIVCIWNVLDKKYDLGQKISKASVYLLWSESDDMEGVVDLNSSGGKYFILLYEQNIWRETVDVLVSLVVQWLELGYKGDGFDSRSCRYWKKQKQPKACSNLNN